MLRFPSSAHSRVTPPSLSPTFSLVFLAPCPASTASQRVPSRKPRAPDPRTRRVDWHLPRSSSSSLCPSSFPSPFPSTTTTDRSPLRASPSAPAMLRQPQTPRPRPPSARSRSSRPNATPRTAATRAGPSLSPSIRSSTLWEASSSPAVAPTNKPDVFLPPPPEQLPAATSAAQKEPEPSTLIPFPSPPPPPYPNSPQLPAAFFPDTNEPSAMTTDSTAAMEFKQQQQTFVPAPLVAASAASVVDAAAASSGAAASLVENHVEASRQSETGGVTEEWVKARSREEIDRLLLEADRVIRERERGESCCRLLGVFARLQWRACSRLPGCPSDWSMDQGTLYCGELDGGVDPSTA